MHLSCYAHQVALIDREFAQLGCFQTDYQVALIDLKNRVLRENLFFIDLMGTGRFTFNNKHILRVYQVALIDHRLVLELVGVSWENVAC